MRLRSWLCVGHIICCRTCSYKNLTRLWKYLEKEGMKMYIFFWNSVFLWKQISNILKMGFIATYSIFLALMSNHPNITLPNLYTLRNKSISCHWGVTFSKGTLYLKGLFWSLKGTYKYLKCTYLNLIGTKVYLLKGNGTAFVPLFLRVYDAPWPCSSFLCVSCTVQMSFANCKWRNIMACRENKYFHHLLASLWRHSALFTTCHDYKWAEVFQIKKSSKSHF